MKKIDLDNAELTEDEVVTLDETELTPEDSEWTNYVLSLLNNNEKDNNGNPTVPGLRRICGTVLGDVVESSTDIIQSPNPDNSGRAVVNHTLKIYKNNNLYVFDGAADCFYKNTDPEYARHAVATAETKAEGRAYKRALKLNTVTAEELTKVPLSHEDESKITDNQMQMINQMGMRVDINIEKLVKKKNPDIDKISKLSHAQGVNLFKVLQSYQNSDVPDDLKGYDANWKNS